MAAINTSDLRPIAASPIPTVSYTPAEDSPRSKRAPWTQIVRGELDSSSSPLAPALSTASSSPSSSGIFEEENAENDALVIPGNEIRKPAWNKPTNKSSASVIGGECWPALSKSSRVSSKSADISSAALTSPRSFKRNGGNPLANGTVGDKPTQFRGNDGYRNTYRNRGAGRNDPNPRNFYDMFPHRPGQRFMRAPPPPGVPTSSPYMIAPPPMRPFGTPMPFPDYSMYYFSPPMPLYPAFPIPVPVPVTTPIPAAAPVPVPAPAPVDASSPEAVVRSKIMAQIDYYFSINNLCKDVYLRNNMDEHGWVSIHLIAEFKRVAELTSSVEVILDALKGSRVVEVQGEKIRKRNDWIRWMMPLRKYVPEMEGGNRPSE